LHDEWLLDGDDSSVVVLDGEHRWSVDEVLVEIDAVCDERAV
jgi:hypothetical protein